MRIKGEGYAHHPHPVALVGAAASGVALDTHRRQPRSEISLLVGLGIPWSLPRNLGLGWLVRAA